MPHEHLSCDWQVHNVLPELLESSTMSWLGHVVSSHLICWIEPYIDVLLLFLIGDKELMNIEVLGSLANTLLAIEF